MLQFELQDPEHLTKFTGMPINDLSNGAVVDKKLVRRRWVCEVFRKKYDNMLTLSCYLDNIIMLSW
jgi:hypothetical protein